MSTRYRIIVVLIAGMLLAEQSMAEIIRLPDSDPEVVILDDEPSRGMTKDRVEQRYGEPTVRMHAVGKPPISRWDYPNYSVYFEGDRVLHAVAHQVAQPMEATSLQTPH